jgi:hypothetical protein
MKPDARFDAERIGQSVGYPVVGMQASAYMIKVMVMTVRLRVPSGKVIEAGSSVSGIAKGLKQSHPPGFKDFDFQTAFPAIDRRADISTGR